MQIGKNSKIIANNIDIHESVEIGDNVQIHCDTIKIGEWARWLVINLVKTKL